jgi:hypothetical protein
MNIFIKTTTFGQNKKLEEWPHFTFLEIPLTSGLPNCHCKLPNKMVNGISLGFTLESTDKALTYFAKKSVSSIIKQELFQKEYSE